MRACKAEVVALVESGVAVREVAEKFSITPQRVYQICGPGFVRRRSVLDDLTDDECAVFMVRATKGLPYEHCLPERWRGQAKASGVAKALGVWSPRGSERTTWTDREVAALRSTYLQMTASEIARGLGRTRNEVIGKARRLGLSRSARA